MTNHASPGTDAPVSFETQIKRLFRAFDRTSMLSRFDLWSYADVKKHAPGIYEQVSQGLMPCDNPWPQQSIDLFDAWMKGGMQP